MHRIILGHTITVPAMELTMTKDVTYYIDSDNLASICRLAGGDVVAAGKCYLEHGRDEPSSILVIRAGAAGDMLFLTPTLRQLSIDYPLARISVACFPKYKWILAHQPYHYHHVNFPLVEKDLIHTDVIDCTDALEKSPSLHAVGAFALEAGVDLSSKKTVYIPGEPVKAFRKAGKGRIGVQWAASTPLRTYPHTDKLLKLLLTEGYQVMLFSEPGPFRIPAEAKKMTINLPEAGLTWEQNMDLVPTCDAVIGPDSSLVHFAGAMGVPAIALYGSYDWRLRTIYQPTIYPIEGTGKCAPCSWQNRTGEIFPPACPTRDHYKCGVLASITPNQIMEVLKGVLK